MKIRILDDSIRLRLSREDVGRLATDGLIEAATRFPTGAFRYRLVTGSDFDARFGDGVMDVVVPGAGIGDWAADDASIGLYGRVDTGAGTLSLVVEKDFHCLIPRPGIDPADFFPNPKTPRVLPKG